mmetsp:Transcript_8033/g.17954  ORF Transcript_8033/g.17954 Transcript_8033/m.17954 type:complete len:503 (+) Transcript_8033:72-1580(+)
MECCQRRLLLFLSIVRLLCCAQASGDDGRQATPWEWAGVFPLEAGREYIWSAEKANEGRYADATMQILLLATEHQDSQGIASKEATALQVWNVSSVPEVLSGDIMPVGTSVNLTFDTTSWVSTFRITVPSTGSYVFFAQHFPTEFENMFHYLKNSDGDDIEPSAQLEGGHGHDDEGVVEYDDRWVAVILGSLATALPSLVLVVLAGPALVRVPQEFLPTVSCFASGAIMSAAVFLMMPEGYLLAGVDQKEVDATWTWGTALMSGWFFSVCIHFAADVTQDRLEAQKKSKQDGGTTSPAVQGEGGGNHNHKHNVPAEERKPAKVIGGCSGIDYAVCAPVLFGDFFHNVVDGFVIGFAAKACSMSLLWSIVVATILHELPQEFGDFVVLIDKGGMPWVVAAAFNFLSGISAVIGAAIAYDSSVSPQFEGLSLAFGAGVYLFIALTELGPAFLEVKSKNLFMGLLRLFLFALGTVCIGLVLLNHEHCIAQTADGEAAGAHAGHNH